MRNKKAVYILILDRIFPNLDPLKCGRKTLPLNSLSANPTKWSNTLKQFVGNLPTNHLKVFVCFVGLALKGLPNSLMIHFIINGCWQESVLMISSIYIAKSGFIVIVNRIKSIDWNSSLTQKFAVREILFHYFPCLIVKGEEVNIRKNLLGLNLLV